MRAIALALLCLASAAQALEYSAPEKFLLKNGLRLVVKTDHSIPRVGLALVVLAGPAEERSAEVGASRVVSGIWADAQADPATAELARRMEANGAYFGARPEGAYLLGLAEFPTELTADGLELASRWLALRKPPVELLNRARDGVVRELGYRKDNPRSSNVVRDQLIARMFPGAPAARALVAGPQAYMRLDPAALETFATRCLSPARTALVVVGDVDSAKLLESVQKAFPQGVPPQETTTQPADATAASADETTFGAVETAVAGIGFRVPPARDPDYPAIALLARYLAGGPGAVLHRRLVERELACREVASELTFQPEHNVLMFELVSASDDGEPAARATLEECARLARHPPEGAALDDLKTGAKAVRALSRQKLVEQAVAFALAELAEDVDLEVDFNHRVDQLTAADLKRAAAKWLNPRDALFTQMRPRTAQGKIAQAHCARELREGVAYNLRRDSSSEVVGLCLYVPGGFYLEKPEQAGISNLLEELLAIGSTAVEPHDATEDRLGRQGAVLQRLKLLLSDPVGKDGIVLSINATLYSFDELLKTLHDIVFEPAFDAASFREAQRRQTEFWKMRADHPEDNGGWELTARLYPGIYARPAKDIVASIQRLTVADLKAFHAQVTGRRNAVVGVSGNLTEAKVADRLRTLWSTAASATTTETLPEPKFEPITGVTTEVLPGNKPYDTVWIGFKMPAEKDIHEVALATIWWTLLGFSRDAKFPALVQKLDPGAKMVSCTYSPRRFGSEMAFGFRVKAGQGKAAAKLLEAEVAGLPNLKPTQDQIEMTRRKIVSLVTMQFQDKVGQATKLGFAAYVKDQPDLYEGTLEAYRTVKVEELEAMVKTHLSAARILVYEGKE